VAAPEPVATPLDPRDPAAFVAATVADRTEPVVLFALEWCEFCWSVRRLFAKLGVRYRSVDLDSVAFQSGRWGERVRAALGARTGVTTIPQVFVGGRFVGGAMDVIDAWTSGALQRELERAGVDYARDAGIDARSFLPAWLQPRKAS
jgi:cysteine synthase A